MATENSRRATYSEKLLDPRWQKKKSEIQMEREFQCESCGSERKTLHVHHIIYRKGSEPWEYDNDELELLCEDCHKKREFWGLQLKESVAKAHKWCPANIEIITGFVRSLAGVEFLQSDEPVRSYGEAMGVGLGMALLSADFDEERSGDVMIAWSPEHVIDRLKDGMISMTDEQIRLSVRESRRYVNSKTRRKKQAGSTKCPRE